MSSLVVLKDRPKSADDELALSTFFELKARKSLKRNLYSSFFYCCFFIIPPFFAFYSSVLVTLIKQSVSSDDGVTANEHST